MEQSANNPASNALKAGVSDAQIAQAVQSSGYPLQTIVAAFLRSRDFDTQEEWGYLDSDTEELRNIDALAEMWLFDPLQDIPRVRPTLNLIVECKQSDMPYVFFLIPDRPWDLDFPMISGLFRNRIRITTDDSASSWTLSLLKALGLNSHTFLAQGAEFCTSFSKGARKGKTIELSGSESFHGLVLPLLKALDHFRISSLPPPTARYFDCHLTIGVGVLDAPMVGVHVHEDSTKLVSLPWVRVLRHDYDERRERFQRARLAAIDVVHKDFFQDYIDQHALPFAQEFARLSIKHTEVLTSGNGFASGMAKDSWTEIESRLQVTSPRTKLGRPLTVGRHFLRSLKGEEPK